MSRLHTDPVEVRRRDDEPAQFLWRGRLYVVREVLAHWTEAGGWWRAPGVSALSTGDSSGTFASGSAPLQAAPLPSSVKWPSDAGGEPGPDIGASIGPAGIDDGERDWWRVEAAAGASAGSGVYDLCFDWFRGAWSLARVLD